MSAREVIAYAITHAPPGVKGGPYEGDEDIGEQVASLGKAMRWLPPAVPSRHMLTIVREVHPHARVIRIVRARPSEAERAAQVEAIMPTQRPSEASATLETARRRLAAVAESMTEHAYQEMASALEVDACRAGPSEASAVSVLRSFIAWVDCDDSDEDAPLRPIEDAARRVLAAAGPDPSEVVRAAMEETEVEAEFFRAERMSEFLAVPRQNLNDVREERRAAVDAYRKAGGK